MASDALRDAELAGQPRFRRTTANVSRLRLATATRCRCRLFRGHDLLPRWTGILTSSAALAQMLNLAMKRESTSRQTLGETFSQWKSGAVGMSQTQTSARQHLGTHDGGKPCRRRERLKVRGRPAMRRCGMFSEMTGDMTRPHYDSALANASPFGGLIVQGGVT